MIAGEFSLALMMISNSACTAHPTEPLCFAYSLLSCDRVSLSLACALVFPLR